jgi:hypothetical protein
MFARDLHFLLTLATLAGMLVVTSEVAVRLARGRSPARFAAGALPWC